MSSKNPIFSNFAHASFECFVETEAGRSLAVFEIHGGHRNGIQTLQSQSNVKAMLGKASRLMTMTRLMRRHGELAETREALKLALDCFPVPGGMA